MLHKILRKNWTLKVVTIKQLCALWFKAEQSPMSLWYTLGWHVQQTFPISCFLLSRKHDCRIPPRSYPVLTPLSVGWQHDQTELKTLGKPEPLPNPNQVLTFPHRMRTNSLILSYLFSQNFYFSILTCF
jgi:hypothetical protein